MGTEALDILRVTFDEETADDLIAIECRECDKELVIGQDVFIWLEPLGKLVVLKTFCSLDCAVRYTSVLS